MLISKFARFIVPLTLLATIFCSAQLPPLKSSDLPTLDAGYPLARRVQAHLILDDVPSACKEVHQALLLYPDSKVLHETKIRALGKAFNEKEMLKAWSIYNEKFPTEKVNRELIEEMAWAVLLKASHSSCLVMRQMALLAAFYTQEARGVTILQQGLQDSNHNLRAGAAKLAASYRDYKLIEEIKKLFKEETVWMVRKQVIDSIGKMEMIEMRYELECLIANSNTHEEEKAVAIRSLVEMTDSLSSKEIERLVKSPFSGLRRMACQAIAHFQSRRDLGNLLELTKDPYADVREEAFQALGLLEECEKCQLVIEAALAGIKDINPRVGLAAARLLILYSPELGQKEFRRFLCHDRRDLSLLAASALVMSGNNGTALALDVFYHHTDPFVRLNLAIGLIGQRVAVEEMTAFIRSMLIEDSSKWQRIEQGLFSAITNLSNSPLIDSMLTPEMENQFIRLELLNLLAIFRDPFAQEAIKNYLSERSWQITGMATALLLTECDDSALCIVKSLLKDDQPRIRLQAALVLSIWGKEEDAIEVLKSEYPKCSWDNKLKILEGFGKVGSMDSVPFLIEVLNEPSQTLRLVAALALIQCLNK